MSTGHPGESSPGSATGAAEIFVVDDERLIGEIIQAVFRMEGFSVRAFIDPSEALAAIQNGSRPDVLVTDFVMRPMNGMELIQQIRAIHPAILTLLYTGNVAGPITDLYAEKPHAFLEKPFHPKKLLRVVQGLLDNRAKQRLPSE